MSISSGKLLEIGCAEGSRLLHLKQEGWGNLYGIELSDAAAKKAQSKGFNVKCGMVEDILNEYPDNYFDVVISSMVIRTSKKSFFDSKKDYKRVESRR